jgi:hypothetical protein
MLLCIVPIKPSAAALERLEAPPLDHVSLNTYPIKTPW